MPSLSRRSLLTFGVPALFLVTGYWACRPLQEIDLTGPWRIADFEDWESKTEAVQRRAVAKDLVASDLMVGKLALLEAAARFRDLNNQGPKYNWDFFRRVYPGHSDDERLCRSVIACVYTIVHHKDPARVEELAGRLEAELNEHLRYGTLRLPP